MKILIIKKENILKNKLLFYLCSNLSSKLLVNIIYEYHIQIMILCE